MKTKKLMKFIYLLSFLLFTVSISAQNVTGTVTSSDGSPLIGATVYVQGSVNGVATDVDGRYSIAANEGDVLIFSYVGFQTKNLEVTGSTIDAILSTATILDDVVVSATRRPVRKLQATTAINSIGKEELETVRPESFTEAIGNTPGVTINNAQGRKGGFNLRGFPGGNVYTTTLIDGLPASGISNLASGTQEFFSFDPSVDRIEVVRGAAATLFGRAAAAGAVNIISKTGGTEHHGSFSLTKYSNVTDPGHEFENDLDYRVDFGFSGPLSEKLRYNVGGFLLNDSGQKEQHHKDSGGQLRGNIDWLISEGSNIRVSASYINASFNNNIETAWDFNKNDLGGTYTGASSSSPDYSQLGGLIPLPELQEGTGDTIFRDPSKFREKTWGGSISLDGTFDLGGGWSFNQKARYQNFNWNDMNDISFSDFFSEDATSVFRFLGRSEQDNQTLISESRISKEMNIGSSVHTFNFGMYYSDAKRDRLGTNLFYFSDVNPRPTLRLFGSGLRNSATTSHREEKSTAVFFGDEMVFNDKLSVNAAFRYDWFTPLFSNDPGEINSTGANVGAQESIGLVVLDTFEFKDYSFSIGANYLIGESSAVYANFLRAFSLPSVTTRTFTAPEGNEIITNMELGYRAGLGDLTVDATLFNTTIDNRVALALNDVTMEFEPRSGGKNKILGTEIALTYTPKAIKGLLIRGNVTVQKSEYDEFNIPLSVSSSTGMTNVDQGGDLFGVNIVGSGTDAAIDLAGNQVEGTPTTILNLNIGYAKDRWGVDFGGFTYSGVKADATNLYDTPNLSIYNAGGYITFPVGENEIKLGLRVKNVLNAATPQALFATTRSDAQLREKQANPEVPEGRLAWAIIQNPRRVLVTAGFSF